MPLDEQANESMQTMKIRPVAMIFLMVAFLLMVTDRYNVFMLSGDSVLYLQ